jgi:Fe2+ or Zn2+ uptake regulation protein
MEIYRVLPGTSEHLSAEVVFRKVKQVFPSISPDTVDRTPLMLSEEDH